ncbi:kinase-like protein [Rhizoclosmatium globosum]|uniref:Kinase-like protein n=1 Tax=Rhizoclosmatium globosum TaxID=329046 RepID=A0A1Y2BSN4_9FUNG|nr:kinase-like protein [Rhizoclosmatium globosum]|eukprot:ORY37762.1 kinase-like protein [Rhizoclosmatium globosum]
MQSSKTIAENMIPCNVPAFFSSFEKKIEKYSQSNSYLQELTEQLTNQCLKQQNDISAMKLEFYAFQTKYLSQIDTQPPSPSVQPVFQQDTTFTVIVPPRLLSPPPLAWGFFQTVTGERIFLVTQTGIQPLSLEHGTLALRESSDQFMQICMFRFCDTVAHDTFIIENIGRQEVIVGQLSTKLAYGERSELVDGAVVQLDKETSVTFHAIHAPGPTSVLIHEILNFDESSSLIGCGATASVFKATCKASGEQVAVKRVDLRGGYFHFDWNMEVEAINKLGSHPRFVELKEVLDEGPFRYLVMELVRGGDLESHLREQGNLTAENTLRLALQISEGIKHMHSVGVTHRDLKPENILCMELDDEISFKIADFGTASFGKLMVSVCGTPGYSANEVFGRTNNNEPYDSGVDCFSLGKILFKARFGVLPPPDLSKMENELLDQRDVQLLAFVKSLVCSASTRLKSHELFNHEYFAVAKDKFSGEVIQKFSPHLRRGLY